MAIDTHLDIDRRVGLRPLVERLHEVVNQVRSPAETAELVGQVLRDVPVTRDILHPDELEGDSECYSQHVLYVDPDGAFSVVGLVWLPGQATPIHDHVSWCVVSVVEGRETERIYELRDREGELVLVETSTNHNETGSVCAFAPPGDIHHVQNDGDGLAISLHVYGADIGKLSTSIRRRYHQRVVPPA